MGKRGGAYGVSIGKPEERDHLAYLSVDVRVILKWALKKRDRATWTGFIWLRIGTGDGLL
jgi:hypothetical protein